MEEDGGIWFDVGQGQVYSFGREGLMVGVTEAEIRQYPDLVLRPCISVRYVFSSAHWFPGDGPFEFGMKFQSSPRPLISHSSVCGSLRDIEPEDTEVADCGARSYSALAVFGVPEGRSRQVW